ncbi:bacterial transcriptional activator domain-containing protein [Kineococcus radiotolerans]|uniref:Response regulator receiver and SARP domain protein n=1 Tax=Kineococcus radiotolerans (strain ATCC BAA-149 / DSM 14245 / SRS30216) TaxID=266940 RepID=A6WH21_KINRD|nr:bacterial transcriptional activator domain-containing protein [Kineococcus radiotolerans]ABS06110.1 response regulator receiver and SARP domain protein [Kineococcus radiotolerans SRS30216 = ATCC BAA-149]
MKQVRAVLAGVALLALVAGVPVLLLHFVGNPLPASVPDVSMLLNTQVDSTFVINTFAVVVWLAWLNFLGCVLVEASSVIGELRGRPRVGVSIPLNFGGQHVARRLVITAVAGIVGVSALGPTAAMAATHTTTTSSVSAVSAVGTGSLGAVTTEASTSPGGGAAALAEVGAPSVDPASLGAPAQAAPGEAGTAPAASSVLPTYEVKGSPGNHDNLWDIAEVHLGDPLRWHEIWDLNHNHVMSDGDRFEHPEMIRPGWVLSMPADAVDLPSMTAAAPMPAVSAPDTGAGEQGGPATQESPSAADQGAGTSTGADADGNGGAGATRASQVPSSPAAQPAPAAPSASAPAAPSASTPSPATSSSSERAAATTSSARDAAASDTADDAVVDMRTVGGIGLLLASGLLGAVALRRRRREVRRRAGFRARAPHAAAAAMETELLSLHTPMSLDLIDRGLRRLSADLAEQEQPLPGIATARLNGEGLLLSLFEAAELPAPWEQVDDEGFEWLLSGAAAAESDDDIDARVPAPWPSLVTLGYDVDDAHLLVDLEELLALNIAAADEQQSQAMLNALALELATTPWGAGLQVTLVGCCEDLAGLVPERMRYLPDLPSLTRELQLRRNDVARVLAESGLDDVAQARQEVEAGDVWSPHIILVGHPLDADEQAAIGELLNDLPRVGIAAVTTDTEGLGEWGLSVDVTDPAWAELTPTRTRLRPQTLGGEDYDLVLQMLDSAEQEASEPVEYAFATPSTEPHLLGSIPAVIDLTSWDEEEGPVAAGQYTAAASAMTSSTTNSTTSPAADVLGEVSDAHPGNGFTGGQAAGGVFESASGDTNGDPSAHRDSDLSGAATVNRAPAHGADLEGDAEACEAAANVRAAQLLREAGFDEQMPLVRVLGPVDVQRDGQTMELTGRRLALGVYLALNPGVGSRELIDDFFRQRTAPTTLHPRVTELRKALGTHPHTGEQLVPLNSDAAGYRLHESVLTDWDLLQRLAASDDIDMLEAALSLVRGVPFARVGSRVTRYYVWTERVEGEIRQLVTDIAVTVAVRAHEAGQFQRAERAAAKGLLLEPGHEQLRRVHWLALAALNKREALRHSVEELTQVNEELGCDEDPDTVTLIDQLRAQGALQAA